MPLSPYNQLHSSRSTSFPARAVAPTSLTGKYGLASCRTGYVVLHTAFIHTDIQSQALLSIFKKRMTDGRERDTALEQCEVDLQAKPYQTECRLIIKMICRHGVVKTYRLTYESVEVLHATFDKSKSENYWSISSRTLRDVVEYFGPKTEQLDWFYRHGKITFTSYTEKVQNGRGKAILRIFVFSANPLEILKQPMHTSVVLERKDFDDFNVQEGLHLSIIVKDFRAIIAHAETMRASVTARYSRGNRPMQFTYEEDGMLAQYTLMTRGSSDDVTRGTAANTPARDLSVRSTSHSPPSNTTTTQPPTTMAPPIARSLNHEPTSQAAVAKSNGRNSPPAPSASINPESLFIPADNEQQWEEPDYGDQADHVTWDNNELGIGSHSTRLIRDSEPTSFRSVDRSMNDIPGIDPTQRLSANKGLFD
jgi:cell cycle checkpoint control protein RAD9A